MEKKLCPQICFKGDLFWQEIHLSEIASKSTEKNKAKDFSETLTNSAEFGIISQKDYFDNRISNDINIKGYYVVRPNYFVYNPRISSFAPVGPINRNKLNRIGVMSPLYLVFAPRSIDFAFLEYYFKTTIWHKHMYFNGNTGARFDRFSILDDDFFKMAINIPSQEVQKKIGLFLSKLEKIISEQEKKCLKLSSIKKSLLSSMFPQKEELVPTLRFKEFAGEWEKGTIESYGYFYYGRSCPKWSVSNKAKTPCIRYGEMYTKFGEKIETVFSHTNMPEDKLRFSNGNEVLVPRVGEDPFDYTHCTWLSIPNVAIGEMISVYNTNQNPLFTAIMFNATLKYEFAKRVQGFTVTNLYYEKLKEIVVKYPIREEQEKISNFVMKIEELKNLENKKLEKLKQLKKAFLQKMYV